MSKKPKKPPKSAKKEKEPRTKTPTFLLELPLQVNQAQAKRIRAHLEAGRALYNAVLSEGQRRLTLMRTDKRWQEAREIPRSNRNERAAAFSALGPSTIALVPRAGEVSLSLFCEPLVSNEKSMRRLQRQMDRQRRAANPQNYDEAGRIKKQGKKRLHWKNSKSYQKTRQRKAEQERQLAAHRKSLQGRLVHEIVAIGNTVILEKISYKAWQKQYGRSVGLRAPGMFVEHLRRTVASTGGTLIEVPTRAAKLSQFCHGCGTCVKKPLSQRIHHCPCGIGPVQRDLYSAFLASTLSAEQLIPSCAQSVILWEGAEARLQAAHERVTQRANEGQSLPRSMGIPRAGVRRPSSLCQPTQEPAHSLIETGQEAWKERQNPLAEPGELSGPTDTPEPCDEYTGGPPPGVADTP